MAYMSKSKPSDGITISNAVNIEHDEDGEISLPNQFKVISSLPNFPHWIPKKQLWVNNYIVQGGNSPRNMILKLLLENDPSDFWYINDILLLVLEDQFTINEALHQHPKRGRPTKPRAYKPKYAQRKGFEDETNDDGVSEQGEDCLVDASIPMEATVYENYKSELIMNGTFLWRVRKPLKDVFLLNGFDPKTGEFRVRLIYWEGVLFHLVHNERYDINIGFLNKQGLFELVNPN